MRPNPNPQLDQTTTEELGRVWPLLGRTMNALRMYFARLLRVSEGRKPEIYAEVFRSAEFADLNYWLEITFSTSIAVLGLIVNSPAVIIGAMLISPLMGPIIASGLAIALGDFYLGLKAFTNVLLSILGSILLAAVITWVLPFRTPTPEILARVQPTLLDLGIAVLSGMAGAIVVCRGGQGGGVTALPGVAVAVALMPPLGVVGFGLGIGWDWPIIRGGGLLFLTNLVAIIFSSFLVFFSVHMDTAGVRAQINKWLEEHEKSEHFYEVIERTPLRRLLGRVGSLPRRVLILLIFVAMVAFPLQQTLTRLTQEARIRRVVLDELHKFIPRDAIFQEGTEIFPDRIRVRVVAVLPEGFSTERRRRLEGLLQARAGRTTQVAVYDVATREELTALTGRLIPPAQPALETSEEIRGKLWARVRPAIASAWPSDRSPLLNYRVTLEPESPVLLVHLVYLAEQDLGELGEGAVRKALRERIGSAAVGVTFERVPPALRLAFPARSANLSTRNRRQLDEVATVLQRFSRVECTLGIGAQKEEIDPLGKQRASRIQEYLAGQKKIAPERLVPKPVEGARDVVVLELVPPAQP